MWLVFLLVQGCTEVVGHCKRFSFSWALPSHRPSPVTGRLNTILLLSSLWDMPCHRAPCSLEHIWIEIPILCDSEQQFTGSYFLWKLSVLVSTCEKPNTPGCVLNMCVRKNLLTDRVKILITSLTTSGRTCFSGEKVDFLAKNLLLIFSIKPGVLKFLLIWWGNFSDKWNKSKFC